MNIVCTYCGSACGEREQANGRCGSCACFFTGSEQVMEDGHGPDEGTPSTDQTEKTNASVNESVPAVDAHEPVPVAPSPAFDPSQVEDDSASAMVGASEGLIQPRKLSKQYRRRVERAWQSTFAGAQTSEHTLNTASPSSDTTSDCPTIHIATRTIARPNTATRSPEDGDYELQKVIGEGSMGQVWSARQNSLDRNVAVKVPRAELAGAGSVGESQFISEVVVTGQLEHPNIVPIYELGRDPSGLPFYSMKHVQGRAWNEIIDERSEQENLEVLMKVCDAVAFAHDRNFLHRDIKPHNVMVGEFGEVSLMDWGIAVAVERDPSKPWASIATGPAGTPAYMAPEMAAHNPSELGVVSDVYLLGAVLYEIATGTPPHPRTDDTREALLAAAANEIVPTDETGELIDIARRAMATNLSDRYQSVPELQDAIREYRSHRESIKLSESADKHYRDAVKNHNSDQFARAKFAYEEALRLWDDNLPAKHGLRVTVLAHAKNALEQENFELGISILDPTNVSHQDLLKQLETKRASSRRLATVSKIAGATAVVAILSVVGVTFFSYQQLKDSSVQLEAEKETAVEQRQIAVKSAREAKLAETVARDAEKKAKLAEKVALAAKNAARGSELSARTEKSRAEEAAYASEIGLAAESIRRNDFDKASRILERMDPSVKDYSLVMSKQRHLEWGILRDAARPSTMHTLVDDAHIEALACSVDGETVVAGTDAGVVFVWHQRAALTDQKPITIQYGTKVTAVAVSPDGRFIAIASHRDKLDGVDQGKTLEKHSIAIWNSQDDFSKSTPRRLSGHTAPVLSLQFSSDASQLLSSASDRKAIVWDRISAKPISVMRDHLERQVWDARFSPDERLVVTACEDGRVRVWEIGDEDEAAKIRDFRGHNGPVYCAAFTLDGTSVISGGFDRRLLRWTIGQADGTKRGNATLRTRLSGDQLSEVQTTLVGADEQQHQASIRDVFVQSVDGRECVLTGGNDNTIRVWERKDERWTLNKVLRGHGRWVRSSVFCDDGRAVLSGAFDGVKRWDWMDYEMPRQLFPIAERRLGKRPSELGLSSAVQAVHSRDGRWVATAYQNGTVSVWNVASKDRSAAQLLGDGHALLTAMGRFFDGGSRLLTSASDNTTRIWDTDRGVQLLKLAGTGYRGAAGVAFQAASNRSLVVTGSDDPMTPAQLWIVRHGWPLVRHGLLQEAVRDRLSRQMGSANASDGGFLEDRTLSQLEFERLRKLRRLIPDITAVDFAPGGSRFVVGNASGQCFLFEMLPEDQMARQLNTLAAHGSAVANLALIHDDLLVSGGDDGQVRLWNASTGEMHAELPWAGPVSALCVSADGRHLIVGHASVEGHDLPIAEAFLIENDTVVSISKLNSRRESPAPILSHPSVQSIELDANSGRALMTLFFPAEKNVASGYRAAWWEFTEPDSNLEWIRMSDRGEIAMAGKRQRVDREQLLVVGGKGARLWDADSSGDFGQLVKSFRPPSSITSLDFSYSPRSGDSTRLVFGDIDGNVRVCQLERSSWSESGLGAESLAGHHHAAIVSTQFHPRDPDTMLTADQTGVWKLWRFDGDSNHWNVIATFDVGDETTCNVAMFSPDGNQVFVGADDGMRCWVKTKPGKYEKLEMEWETGPVRRADISHDRRLIVTSDGERNVSFWNSDGKLIARLDEDDAMSVRSLSLSRDRRRLVTGQGKRIVIWDTSRLVDLAAEDAQNGRRNNGHLVSELLSLEQHRAVSSVEISPDGQNLLSAGTEGQTLIWSGKPILPMTMTPSASQIAYQVGANAIPLDKNLEITDPCNLVNLAGAELTVVLDRPINGERLTIGTVTSSAGSRVEVVVDDSERVVVYRPFDSAPATRIATLLPNGGHEAEFKARLDGGIDAESLQCLLRSLAYQIPADRSIAENVSLNGEDAGIGLQKATLKIEGLRYRSRHATGNESGSLCPDSLETTIEIEIEESTEHDESKPGTMEPNVALIRCGSGGIG